LENIGNIVQSDSGFVKSFLLKKKENNA